MVGAAKTLLGCLGLAGTSCALVVPVSTYGASKNSELENFLITKCDLTDSKDREHVEIGAEREGNVCGKIEKTSESDYEEEDDEDEGSNVTDTAPQLADLLKELGIRKGNDNYGNGTKECNKGNLKGKLIETSGETNRPQALGYCDPNLNSEGSNDSTINFVELQNDKDISVCVSGKECGTDNISAETPVTFQQKSANHGRVIKFFRQK